MARMLSAVAGPVALVVVAVVLSITSSARAKIIHAAVIPHGDFAYDPSLVDFKNGSREVHDAAVAAGEAIARLAPDLVFISTPHGVEDSNNFLLYQNSNASGFALLGQDLHNASFPCYKVPLNFSMSPQHVTNLVARLRASDSNVSSLLSFANSEPSAIRWGEVIPLTFIKSVLNPQQQQQHRQPHQQRRATAQHHERARSAAAEVIVWSVPSRRYNHSTRMIPELLKLGEGVGEYLEQLDERVVVVVSSDLAHTHLASGPYGFSTAAEPFDKACGMWGGSLQPVPLLETAASYVDKALSCGYTGLVWLHGMLTHIGRWQPKMLANFHPTYYGMMVASFSRLE